MKAISLQSGSSGNCIYIEHANRGLLIDAGISGIQAERRLRQHDRDIRDVSAILVSHDHSDHSKSAGIFSRKYGIPVYMTRLTHGAAGTSRLGEISDLRYFTAGDTIDLGPISVETIQTPHDGADGVVFVVSANGKRMGVLTDLGHVFDGLGEIIASLDAVFLESNYAPYMLENGPYPAFLKERIKGKGGHISNQEAADLISSYGEQLQWACLSHLSGDNNCPDLALDIHRKTYGTSMPLHIADRTEVSDLLYI